MLELMPLTFNIFLEKTLPELITTFLHSDISIRWILQLLATQLRSEAAELILTFTLTG